MQNVDVILFLLKVIFGGILAALAIMLWSKTGDPAWMSMIAGTVINFAGNVLFLLDKTGLIMVNSIRVGGFPLVSLLFAVIPSLFFILSFSLMILRYNRNS